MDATDVRRMVGMIRAIRAGKWTNELPSWAPKTLTSIVMEDEEDDGSELRAVQTAEAFIMLAHASRYEFEEEKFLKDCGFVR